MAKKSKKYMTEAETQAREIAKEKDAQLKKFQKQEEWTYPDHDQASAKREELKANIQENQRIRIRRRQKNFGVVIYQRAE